jgi:hypothetical protein
MARPVAGVNAEFLNRFCYKNNESVILSEGGSNP